MGQCAPHRCPETHTIPDPWAVVVHAEHADAAHMAVVGALGARHTTLPAHRGLPGLKLKARGHHDEAIPHLADELVPLFRHHAGVVDVCHNVTPYRQTPCDIEKDHERDDHDIFPQSRQNPAEVHHVERETFIQEYEQAAHHRRLYRCNRTTIFRPAVDTRVQTCMRTRARVRACTCTRTRTRIATQTHIHTFTNPHTHTCETVNHDVIEVTDVVWPSCCV